MNEGVVSIDGRLSPPGEARISVFDRGFLFGDSVYEVLRTVNRRLLFWPAHADRLWRSAALIGLELPFMPESLRAELDAALAAAPERGEQAVRVIVTRGVGPLTLDPDTAGPPTRIVITQPLPVVPPELLAHGCRLRSWQTHGQADGCQDPRAKTGSKLIAVRGLHAARVAGAYESLRLDGEHILEGGTSTFFLVIDGAVCTPPLDGGILEGITRAEVLRLARAAGVPVIERALTLADLPRAQEAFITSSVRGLVPVRQIDDDWAAAAPGPVTARLMAAYADRLAAEAAG